MSFTKQGTRQVLLDRTPNRFPKPLLDKLKMLGDDEVVKLRLRETQFRTVTMQTGDSLSERPKHTTTFQKAPARKILSPVRWKITWDNSPLDVGFFKDYDQQDNPTWHRFAFDTRGEMFLRGANGDLDKQTLLQVQCHPKIRYSPLRTDKSGAMIENKDWVFEIVLPEVEATDHMVEWEKETKLRNRIINLSTPRLNVLMSHSAYNMPFYNQPHLVGNPVAARSFLASKMGEKDASKRNIGIGKLTMKLDHLEKASVLSLIQDALIEKRLILTDKVLKSKTETWATLDKPVLATNPEELALEVYEMLERENVVERYAEKLDAEARSSRGDASRL